ncbi:MAG: glycosyltransferase family 1 protein [Desulfobacterales bacterium]|nr:glycosyltransferase family 1 protein [Desulfobacterales bacterium]MCP4161892.1 glycosyltransferase family 1 protein [Deltaproteobacteria bacterium]
MKILLTPIGTEGDVRPIIALGCLLRDQGNDVSVCSTRDFKKLSEKHSFKFYPINISFKELAINNKDVVGKTFSSTLRFKQNLREVMDVQLDVLGEIIKGYDYVIGSGLQLSAFSIAEKLSVKYSHILFAPNWVPSNLHSPPQVPVQFKDGAINKLLWFFFKSAVNLTVKGKINRYRRANSLEPIKDIFETLKDKTIISHSPVLSKLPDEIKSISYLNLEDINPLPELVTEFIENGAPPIYIGFGSMPGENSTIEIFKEVIETLGLRAIIQKGWAGFETENSNRFLEVGEISHGKLFTKMRFIVHHGGAGTTFNAAKSGVPQLIIPHLLDQFYWGDKVKRLGIGPKPICFKKISGKNIKRAFERLVKEDQFLRNAQEIALKIANEETVHVNLHGEM